MLQVLRALLSALPGDPEVSSFMLDFEAPLWTALKKVFPDAVLKGCVFHRSQAVWRHVQAVGLQRAYHERNKLHKLVRYV